MSSPPETPSLLVLAPLPGFLMEPLRERFVCHEALEGLSEEDRGEIRAVVGTGGTDYAEAMLRTLPRLEIVAVNGVGYDGVPLDWCRARGIRVTNTPDVLTEDVADLALALVLMTSRRLVEANRHLHAGHWLQGAFGLGARLAGKKAGILGLGRIGKAIASRLAACGMVVGYTGRRKQPAEPQPFFPTLLELAAWGDFLVVASPGGHATRHLVNEEVLAALGPDGTLINIARGSVVDEPALVAALQRGVIKNAGLDVFEDEPKVPAELLAMEQVVLLPHVGSGTLETRQAMARLVLGNLEAHFAGRPLLTPVPELAV